MTLKEKLLDKIIKSFTNNVTNNEKAFRDYDYSNHKCESNLENLYADIRSFGLTFGNVYHAHGIGNNNEWRVFLKETDKDGFTIEKNVAKLHVTYGVFGGVSAWVEDYNTGKRLCSIYHAR